MPGDKEIVFAGTDADGGARMYVQPIDGGAPRAVTPVGVTPLRNTVSPDGAWLAEQHEGGLTLFPIGGGEPRTVPGSQPGDQPIRWNTDGRVLFIRNGVRPVNVYGLDVATGSRTLLHEFTPRDPVGASPPTEIRLTPDGRSYAYGYLRTLQSLYRVSGVR